MKSFAIAVLAAGSLVAFSGCGAISGEDGDPRVTQNNYDPELCKTLLPTTGAAAIYSQLDVSNPVTSAYFEKRYNRAFLEGILGASGVETQIYAKKAGIHTYKISAARTKKGACLFQHDLDEAPARLRQDWDEVAGADHGDGQLDGLFVAYSDGVHAGGQQAIMVREESSRWTLVHEMMHANFARQRAIDGTPSAHQLESEMTRKYSTLKAEFSQYQTSPTADLLTLVTSDANEVAHVLYAALVSGSLEEIADESLLLEEWAGGRLMNVSKSSARNAPWYINYARTLSLEDLNAFQKNVSDMRDYVAAHPPVVAPSPTATAEFQKTLDFIAGVNQNTADLAQKAKDRTASLEVASSITSAASFSAYVEMTNPHLIEMNNTPALREFRRQNSAFAADLAHSK